MSATRRDEQKLWLILFQIRGIRSRLNLLTGQQWLFTTLAVIIGGGALVLLAAARLGPLSFLGATLVILIVAAGGLIGAARRGWAGRIDPMRAAGLADDRAGLKGRLTTVLALAETVHRGQLWPFLVEDTYALRDNYEPRRIEPRLVSRSLFALLAALLLAALATPDLNRGGASRRRAAGPGAGGEITADIDHLEIQPADPALEPNAQIYADPETLRRLQEKLSAGGSGNKSHGLGGLMNRARQFADAFQHKLTGRNSAAGAPTRLRLTERNPAAHGADGPRKGGNQAQNLAKNSAGAGSNGMSNGAAPNANHAHRPGAPPVASIPGAQADQMANGNPDGAAAAAPESNPNGANSNANPPEQDASNDAGGGANHGVGADPGHLFGPAAPQPFGSDSFKIAIEAEPSDEASAPGSPTYMPPRVRVPLNPNQLPDEPIARAAVPADDQMTIKRVFDR